jgi:intracellular sulfur oxidation DsrE/DsrF family protein
MITDNNYSEEQLQAFVDDEIDLADRAEIMEAIRHDDELACRVCELLQIKDSVRLAYREPEHPAQTRQHWGTDWSMRIPLRAIAALLIFATGTVTGVVLQSRSTGLLPTSISSAGQAGAVQQEQKRVVLHISNADSERLDEALNDAEELLSTYKDHPELVQLEVVANAEGLKLLRADTSPYPERIRRLAELYDNISFLACSRTIEKLHMRGIDVQLLPEARVIPGALEEIVDRLQQGWVYIRV